MNGPRNQKIQSKYLVGIEIESDTVRLDLLTRPGYTTRG